MSLVAPHPLPTWYLHVWEPWREAGGLPPRPRGMPSAYVIWRRHQWVYPTYRLRHPASHPPVFELGVFERVAFFINPTAGSPAGGAKEILAGAAGAGFTCSAFNSGDRGDWSKWIGARPSPPAIRQWARCDTGPRCATLTAGDIANPESPEIVNGFCTPGHAVELVTKRGGIITEGLVPHADWKPANGMPVWLEIDPTVPKYMEKLTTVGVKGLVAYARVLGIANPLPCFFIIPNPMWDGSEQSFPTYWSWLRSMWPAPLPFALYSAENVPRWSVIQ